MSINLMSNSLTCQLWKVSRWLHQAKIRRLAKIVKGIVFISFHAILPPEAEVGSNLDLAHYGLGTVIHPNVTIGDDVVIYHHVTIAVRSWIGSPHRIYIGNNVLIGAGAVILSPENKSLYIGDGAKIGANAVVTKDIAANTTVVGIPARSTSHVLY
jgi:serine O-acetyltransferase